MCNVYAAIQDCATIRGMPLTALDHQGCPGKQFIDPIQHYFYSTVQLDACAKWKKLQLLK